MRLFMENIVLAVAFALLLVLFLIPGKGFGGSYEVERGLDDPPVIEPAPRPASLGWGGPYAGVMAGVVSDNVRHFDCGGNLDWTGGCDPRVPDELIGNPDIQELPIEGSDHCGNFTFPCAMANYVDVNGNYTALWIPPEGFWMETPITNPMAGGFAGYRWQRNRLVFGVEAGLGVVNGSVIEHGAGGTVPGTRWSDTTMGNGRYGYLEGQVGWDAGRLLPYASAGAMWLHGETGGMIGLGADLRIGETSRWLAGVKAQRLVGSKYEATVVTVRLGMRF